MKNEFDRSYGDKSEYLLRFFYDLQKFLESPKKEFYTQSDLFDFVHNHYPKNQIGDISSSITPFWGEYFGIQSQILLSDMKIGIDECLNDLLKRNNAYKKFLENKMLFSPKRTNDYDDIDSMLKLEGVHEKDRIIILDDHDFACRSNSPIDFVTFDNDCFNGAKNVEILCFNSIKETYDFTAS